MCLLNDKKKFTGFKEKPSYDFLFNTGLYLINKTELKILKKNQKVDMDDFILRLKKKKKKIGLYQLDHYNGKTLVIGKITITSLKQLDIKLNIK